MIPEACALAMEVEPRRRGVGSRFSLARVSLGALVVLVLRGRPYESKSEGFVVRYCLIN